ncbi:TRAP transporter small permease [Denitrobaculum tricleocarpae]|uniref:TRAP transporter small permease protein n=1 Tax=Denitrobaculum tricleocarpae TaxID=2591009 RepID=A0A545TYX0_9PROT|nr:TRAP transporter small permease [Denitrobaculum tricleocarpae]
MSAVTRWLGFLRTACIFFSSCALVVLVVIFGWLVFGRYVLNVTPTWVEQMALLLVCYIAFLGASAGVYEDTHLGVTFFRNALRPTLRRIVRAICDLALAGFGLVMLLSSIELVEFGWSTMLPMLDIPEGIRTLPAAICGALMLLFSGTRTIDQIVKLAAGVAPEKDGTD